MSPLYTLNTLRQLSSFLRVVEDPQIPPRVGRRSRRSVQVSTQRFPFLRGVEVDPTGFGTGRATSPVIRSAPGTHSCGSPVVSVSRSRSSVVRKPRPPGPGVSQRWCRGLFPKTPLMVEVRHGSLITVDCGQVSHRTLRT